MLENNEAEREKLTLQLDRLNHDIYNVCVRLSEKRKNTANTFTASVAEELKSLNIGAARFEITFEAYDKEDVEHVTAAGLDKIKFLFSANKGEPLKELSKIISGGEMSRFMLAVKTVLNSGGLSTYIFDEIDAGIGGKTAWVIAEKFAKIASRTQIIAVSHLAQIACFADRQFLIEKGEVGDKTVTTVREVTGSERTEELARLIAGNTEELSIKQAEELLGKAKKFKETL